MIETWTCHVCGDERPDEFISVFSRTGSLAGMPYQENVRHCNDRPACIEGAKKVRWVQAPDNNPGESQ